MKQFLCFVALLLTLPSCQVAKSFTEGVQEGYSRGATETRKKSLQQTADQLNKTVPSKIDEETTLTKVDVEKDGLLYNYELANYSSAQISNDAAVSTLRPIVKERICTDSATKADLKNGYSYYYAYFGNDKKLITKFAITPKDCNL